MSKESEGVAGGFRKRRKRRKGWEAQALKAAQKAEEQARANVPSPGDVTIHAPVATASGEVKKES